MKKGQYVKGINSPFMHGKIETIEESFVRLTDGSVYPKCSVKICSAREAKQMPNFINTLRNSKRGLNLR